MSRLPRWISALGFAAVSLMALGAQAKVTVVTTIPDLRYIATQVGGELVTVESIAKGTQDPHYIEAKPSFMSRVNGADLVIAIGLDLEDAWLNGVLHGARNPKVNKDQKGFLAVGELVNPLEVATQKVSRADGDVHPNGNPHVTLDPERAGRIAIEIAKRLGEIDAAHAPRYLENAKIWQASLEKKTAAWKARIQATQVKKVITYHRTLNYFLDRFALSNPIFLEPKPGIPPTSPHMIEVIATIRREKIPLILVENYFDPTITKKILSVEPGVKVAVVPVSVDGEKNMSSLEAVYENLVKTIEGAVAR